MLKKIYEKLPKTKVSVLATTLISIIVVEITLTCLIPIWREHFYNILQTLNVDMFYTSLTYFAALMLGMGAVQGLKTWIGQLLSFQIRQAATKVLFKPWVKGKRAVKNYSQAMTESLRNSTELYLEIIVEVIISGAIVVGLIVSNIHNMPVIVASIIYTAAVTLMAALFNKPLVNSDAGWQEAEGNFREAIGNIANGNEDFTSKQKFAVLINSYYTYIRVVMYYTLFSRVKSSASAIIPYLLMAGPYFAQAITLGDFMSSVAVFELIVINSTILTMLYPKLTKARASYKLSKEFYQGVIKE
mgnify:FL=1